jgi:hypothetical protein
MITAKQFTFNFTKKEINGTINERVSILIGGYDTDYLKNEY